MKGKFIKKLTAYALTVAMVAATPMTAFASEFADNFWVDDGNKENNKSETGTGTVTSTASNTTVLGEYSTSIVGIKINPASVVIELAKDRKAEVKAEVLYDSENEPSETIKKKIERSIEWKTSDLAIVRPDVSYEDRTTCHLTGYKGGFATITAFMDVDGDGVTDFEARTRVMVKKQATSIAWNKLPKKGEDNVFYANHTYDLMDYIKFTPDDAYDEIDFTMSGLPKNKTKLVSLNDGVLKLGKVKDKDNLTITLTAVTKSNQVKAETVVKLSEGVPITGWEKVDKKAVDIATEYTNDKRTIKQYDVSVTPKTKSGATTDDITWTSSNPQVVKVIIPKDKTGNTEKDGAPLTDVKYVAVGPGKAQLVATATSGKSVKINVTVTATLREIKSASVDATYTGKATAVKVVRIPEENQDKLKFVLPKGTKGLKAKAAITPILTPGADLSKISGTGDANKKTIEGITVVSSKDKTKVSPKFDITISQSDVELQKVVVAKDATVDVNKKTFKLNPGRITSYFAMVHGKIPEGNGPEAQATVSWETSKETVATVDGGRVKVVGEGTAKITASAVSNIGTLDKPKYKVIKKAFTIKATPKCEQIIFKADRVTYKSNAKDTAKVVINIKQQVPKKANDTITWYVLSETQLIPMSSGIDGDKTDKKKGIDNKKFTMTVAQVKEYAAKNGGVVTVIAKTGTVEAQAKIVCP